MRGNAGKECPIKFFDFLQSVCLEQEKICMNMSFMVKSFYITIVIYRYKSLLLTRITR